MEYGAALTGVAVVDRVFRPHSFVVVHVHGHKSRSRLCGIPSCLLTVFEDYEFVGVTAVVYYVCGAALACGFEAVHIRVGGKFHRGEPSGNHFLVGGVARGGETAVVVAAVVHEVPHVHAEIACSELRCIVYVGVAEAMREFMAYRADAVYHFYEVILIVESHFAAAGIGVDVHIVEGEYLSVVAVGERPFVRPDGVGRAAGGFAEAGIEGKYLVDHAVAVPVVVGEIHGAFYCLAGFGHHLAGMGVAAEAGVTAVVDIGIGHGHGADDIEFDVERSQALVLEVVSHAAVETVFGSEAGFVGHFFVEFQIVLGLELLVAEGHQYDKALFLAFEHFAGASGDFARTCTVGLIEHRTTCLGMSGQLGLFDVLVAAVGVGHVAFAAFSLVIVDYIVAGELCADLAAVGKPQGFPKPPFGGDGEDADRQREHDGAYKKFFHMIFRVLTSERVL